MKKILFGLTLFTFLAFVSKKSSNTPEKPEDISPLLVGETIPKTILMDITGKPFDLNALLAQQQTILIFYRGGWCPFCIKHLAEIQKIENQLSQAGWQVVAVSPDSPENLKNTAEKQGLSLKLLSDADMQFAKNLGIAFKGTYGKMLVEKSGGKNTEQLLPVPAVFMIDKNSMIRFEHINPDFKDRIPTTLLLSVAKTLSAQ
ncbi:MAG: AhpC/TSA family protein [Cytophagales bacterium]|nr:MAG: AhpC/TSA family protein [Cytophagales bacterium]